MEQNNNHLKNKPVAKIVSELTPQERPDTKTGAELWQTPGFY